MDSEQWTGDKSELEAWNTAPLADLVKHIVERYHREGRVEMARLEAQAEEAVLMEGRNHPVLLEIRDEVERFCTELRAHFRQEERVIFPAILEQAEGGRPALPLEPVKLLEDEHVAAAGLLTRIRALTEGFQPPEGARAVQRKLYETLQILAHSLGRHIYLENNILFKRIS